MLTDFLIPAILLLEFKEICENLFGSRCLIHDDVWQLVICHPRCLKGKHSVTLGFHTMDVAFIFFEIFSGILKVTNECKNSLRRKFIYLIGILPFICAGYPKSMLDIWIFDDCRKVFAHLTTNPFFQTRHF